METNTAVDRLEDIRARVERAQSIDPQLMGDLNWLSVLNYIRKYGPTSRFKIANATNLSGTTVSKIIHQLMQEDLVRAGDTIDASPRDGRRVGGRRATEVQFNADVGFVVGVDLGRKHLTLSLTNLAFTPIGTISVGFDANQGPAVCMPQLAEQLCCFIAAHQLNLKQLVGIGMGIPGPMDATRHSLVDPPHMAGWDGKDIRQLLAGALQIPIGKIYVDNDANMGALGESTLGGGQGISNLVYLKVGTGIGVGLIIDGQLYRGSRGSAGELGHISLDTNGRQCTCGRRGCLETVAGGEAILVASGRGPNDNISDVLQAAQAGDTACFDALQMAGEQIGRALANMMNLLNPSKVLIGGGVADAGYLILDPIRRTAKAWSLRLAWESVGDDNIVQGALGKQAVALGAAVAVVNAAFRVPSVVPEFSGANHDRGLSRRAPAETPGKDLSIA